MYRNGSALGVEDIEDLEEVLIVLIIFACSSSLCGRCAGVLRCVFSSGSSSLLGRLALELVVGDLEILGILLEAGGNYSDVDLVLQALIAGYTPDDVCLGMSCVVNPIV